MQPQEESIPVPRDAPVPMRHSGWAALMAVLGIVFVMIGVMLVAMIQAPVVPPRIVVTGFALIAFGLLLLPVAWFGRRPKS
jgi:hypothetical protein